MQGITAEFEIPGPGRIIFECERINRTGFQGIYADVEYSGSDSFAVSEIVQMLYSEPAR